MKFWRNKKIILGVLAVAVFGFTPAVGIIIVQAQPDDLTVLHEVLNPDYGTAASQTKEIGTIVTVITTILSWALSVVAGLVDFALNLGNSVLKLDVVTIGWRIVLNFTNLGFVLAIIVIAFATIFRLQSYAMKQVLWKLIVAALLVNFSLVIAGAFISVSITVTNIFLEATTFDSLSNALGNAMQPQKLVEVGDPTLWQFIKGAFSYFLKFIFSLLFVAVFTFLTILVFLTLFLMLLVRAIALAFLLILSPIVWLLWIFPATNKYWQQWWQEFIRWNVFAPAVLFFVYLTVIASTKLGELKSIKVDDIAAIEAAKGQLMLGNEAIQHGADLFILLGILFGGIYVANKFGIAGGGMGVKLAQGAGKWVQGAVGRAAGRTGLGIASRTVGSERVKGWSEKLATKGFAGRFVARGLNRLGAGTEQATQKAYENETKLYSGDRLQTAIMTSSGAKKAAFLNKAITKEKRIDDKVKEKYFSDPEIMEKTEKEMARSGYSPKNIAKHIGYNSEIARAEKDHGKESEEFKNATNKLYNGFSPEDWNKVFPSALIDSKFGEVITKNLLQRSPGSLGKIVVNIKKQEDLDKITAQVNKELDKILDKATMSESSREETDFANKLEKSVKKGLSRRFFEIEKEEKEEEVKEPKEEKKGAKEA